MRTRRRGSLEILWLVLTLTCKNPICYRKFCTDGVPSDWTSSCWDICWALPISKGSFTLTAAVCGFRSGLRQRRDRNFSISAEQCNRLPQTYAENAVMWMSLYTFKLDLGRCASRLILAAGGGTVLAPLRLPTIIPWMQNSKVLAEIVYAIMWPKKYKGYRPLVAQNESIRSFKGWRHNKTEGKASQGRTKLLRCLFFFILFSDREMAAAQSQRRQSSLAIVKIQLKNGSSVKWCLLLLLIYDFIYYLKLWIHNLT